jgi:hypothetical protein
MATKIKTKGANLFGSWENEREDKVNLWKSQSQLRHKKEKQD